MWSVEPGETSTWIGALRMVVGVGGIIYLFFGGDPDAAFAAAQEATAQAGQAAADGIVAAKEGYGHLQDLVTVVLGNEAVKGALNFFRKDS